MDLGIRLRGRGQVLAQRIGQRPGVLDEHIIVCFPRRVEQGANLLIGQAIDQAGLADHGLAAAFTDLFQHPLKILLRLLIRGQRIDRVFDRHGAERLQAAPDLDAQIGGLRRDLVDQQQPAVPRRGGVRQFHSASVSF